MTLVGSGDLVTAAVTAGGAALAFNVITLEHAEGIAAGVERTRGAAILQISENAIRYHGGRLEPLAAACARVAVASSAPLAIHLDHVRDAALLETALSCAADLHVGSVMIDAAHLPYDDNVAQTRAFAERAHAVGLWVEAELGEIGGKDGAHAPGVRTDPAEAAAFVAATGVDALAVAVGSAHAMTRRDAEIDVDLVRRLAAAVPVPLVLHGGSGVPDAVVRHAVAAGMRKLNVGTALNVAFTEAVRHALAADPSVTDPRRYLDAGRAAVADVVAERCRALVAEVAR